MVTARSSPAEDYNNSPSTSASSTRRRGGAATKTSQNASQTRGSIDDKMIDADVVNGRETGMARTSMHLQGMRYEGQSDDEIGASHSERAELEQMDMVRGKTSNVVSAASTSATAATSGRTSSSRSRGRGGLAAAAVKSASRRTSAARSNQQQQQHPQMQRTPEESPSELAADYPVNWSERVPTPPTESDGSQPAARASPPRVHADAYDRRPVIERRPTSSSSSAIVASESRDVARRNSGSAYALSPFHPRPHPNAGPSRATYGSPTDHPLMRGMADASPPERNAGSLYSTSKSERSSKAGFSPTGRDLSSPEVDKFMDLIEKHNLHTSNEEEMARSVTELYQEWLEWCAKRNTQSTKSKQALVAEFLRIHQGDYGPVRQQRALEIVKDNAVKHNEKEAGRGTLLLDTNEQLSDPPPATAAPSKVPQRPTSSLSTTSSHANRTAGHSYKEDKRDIKASKAAPPANPARRMVEQMVAAPLRSSISTASPAEPPKVLPPAPVAVVYESAQATTSAQREALYWQIRDDVWRDTSAMINRVVQEKARELVADNTSLRGRVEQLEIHSDNLALWIQHLNRVQDDFSQSLTTPPTRIIREEVLVDDPSLKHAGQTHQIPPSQALSHPRSHAQPQPRSHPQPQPQPQPHPQPPPQAVTHVIGGMPEDRRYHPAYAIPSSSLTHSSPKRTYAVRRSPSPVPARHAGSAHQAYSRIQHVGGGGGPPPGSIAYREISRDSAPDRHYMSVQPDQSAPIASQRVVLPPEHHYDRPHHAYPPEHTREYARPLPPALPASSPRHMKRARNGY